MKISVIGLNKLGFLASLSSKFEINDMIKITN